MARRNKGLLDELSVLPWPVSAVLGIVVFIFIGSVGGPFVPFAFMALALCWAASLISFLKALQRKSLLERQTGLDSLAVMTWREFEMLVGEAFRRRGWSVEETGLGGADGGIDLILRKDGRTELVQCKQWRSRQVKPATVREMWGLVDHHDADGVKIVCVGEFTRDAAAFADGKAIELINGERLLALVRETQAKGTSVMQRVESAPPPPLPENPDCPRCGAGMVRRSNRANGQSFWGCASYPRCRGTRPTRLVSENVL